VFTLRDRKITRICRFQDADEALKALGLEDQTASRDNAMTLR